MEKKWEKNEVQMKKDFCKRELKKWNSWNFKQETHYAFESAMELVQREQPTEECWEKVGGVNGGGAFKKRCQHTQKMA